MTRAMGVGIAAAAVMAAFATSAQSITGAPDLSGYVTQPQLASQSASDIAAAGSNVPPLGMAAGFITSAQTQTLLNQIAQSFIPGYTPSSPGTTASLLTNYPATTAMAGKYAVVSDLFGNTNEVLRAGCTGTNCYWRPQRTDFATSTVATGGALTLTPLANAPFQYLTGTLASSLTINLSATNAWPGASFCVSNNLTLGLFTVSLQGVGLPSTNMVSGASKCAYFDGSQWRPF